MIRFRPPRIALACVAVAMLVDAIAGTRLSMHAPQVVGGPVIGVAGLLVMLWGWGLFVTSQVAIRPTAETTRLVTHGVFRVTRNRHTATVTRRNVAGIEVTPRTRLWFSRSTNASTSRRRSIDRPDCSAAAKAFIVGP